MNIEIYTKITCPFCVKLKNYLNENNLTYTEYVVGSTATKEDIQRRVNEQHINVTIQTVPQMFVDGKYIGNSEESINYLAEGAK